MCRTKSIPGVYLIRNMANFSLYVGSTNNMSHRWKQHIYLLRHNKHSLQAMQDDFNLYGEDLFEFSVLEEIEDVSKLIEREQYWIDSINPSYNINRIAGSFVHINARTKKAKKKLSKSVSKLWDDPEYRANWMEKMRPHWDAGGSNKGRKLSDETKEKLRQANLGENNPNYGKPRSESFLKKVRKTYPGAVSPDGVIYSPIVGMAGFCREHGLDDGAMSRLMSGKVKSHRGWTKYG